jgi:hypothetical protein
MGRPCDWPDQTFTLLGHLLVHKHAALRVVHTYVRSSLPNRCAFPLNSTVGFWKVLRVGKTCMQLRSFSAFNCEAGEIVQYMSKSPLRQ